MSKEIEKEFFRKLSDQLEDHYPKGERCECGKRLTARSKALTFNAWANVFLKEALDEHTKKIIDEVEQIMMDTLSVDEVKQHREVLKMYKKLDKLKKLNKHE